MRDCQKFLNGTCTNTCKVCKITGKRQDGLPEGAKGEDYDRRDF